MGVIIKGKPVADAITLALKKDVEDLKLKNITPTIKVVRVGEREDDISYEKAALKRMEKCGIECNVLTLSEDISQNKLIEELNKINEDNAVHGILLFRPLPKHIDENIVKYIIKPEKDIDCFHPINTAKVMEGEKSGFPPCTPSAAIELLKHYGIELKGKKAVVVGRSMVVGKPLAMMLLKEDATVTICHSKTENLSEITSKADILIGAVGKSKMITKDYIKNEAVIIDVGINVDEEGNLSGDVNTEDCLEKSSYITPVPSGVGSVTTAILAKHVVKACRLIIDE